MSSQFDNIAVVALMRIRVASPDRGPEAKTKSAGKRPSHMGLNRKFVEQPMAKEDHGAAAI